MFVCVAASLLKADGFGEKRGDSAMDAVGCPTKRGFQPIRALWQDRQTLVGEKLNHFRVAFLLVTSGVCTRVMVTG